MSQRVNEYFANEASEYIDQLERLLAVPGVPDPDHLFRVVTGVRGSAQMAHAESVARVAERLEDAARSIVLRDITWSEELRGLARQTVDDLKLLVRALHHWGPDEDSRAVAAIERWDEHGKRDAPAPEPGSRVVPIESLLQDDADPGAPPEGDATAATAPEPEGGTASAVTSANHGQVVPIESLLFSSDAALREALALRPHFDAIARGDAVSERPTAELVQELFDLLELGLGEPTEA